MNFCENCGEKIVPGQKFCEQCGTAVVSDSKNTVDEQINTPINREVKNKPARKPMSKGKIAGIVLLVIIIGSGYFAYQYGEEYYSKSNQVDRIVAVLKSEDYAAIADLMNTNDAELDINEETIVPYVDAYLTDLDSTELRTALLTESDYLSLSVLPEGSYFFLFDKYELNLFPSYVRLTTNMNDTALFLNEEELTVSDSEDFTFAYGPMISGEYTFSAVTDIDGEELTTEENRLIGFAQDSIHIDLPIYGLTFSVSSNVNDSFVYLNGENIGQLHEGEGQFGPFGSLAGAELELRKEESFGEISTETISLMDYDGEYYYLRFDDSFTVESAEDVMRGMYSYLSNLTQSSLWDLEGTTDYFGEHFYQGIAYDELRPFFLEYAERQRENDDIDRTTFEVSIESFEQVDMNEYSIELEVNYITQYDWSLDSDDRIRTFTYDVSLIASDSVRNTWSNDEELFINGFANESLIYDSND